MKRVYDFFHDKALLKFLIVMITIALASSIYLLQSTSSAKYIPLQQNRTDNSVEIKRLTDIADMYFDSNKNDSAIYTFNKVRKLCNPETNSIDYVYALSCIAEIQYSQSDFMASEAAATAALPYLKNIKNPRYSWIVYNLLGLDYLNSYDQKNAILYFKKAIKLKTTSWRKSAALNNLIVVYMSQNKYKESKILLEILASQKKISAHKEIDENNYAFILNNLGFCHFKLGEKKKSLALFHQALQIRKNQETSEGLSDSYRNLSRYYQQSNPKLAKEYAIQALDEDILTNSPSKQITSLDLIIKSSDGNDLKKYTTKYISLVDSLDLARKKSKTQFSRIKYNFSHDKEENLQLKAQKTENEVQLERQENRIVVSYIIIMCILTLVSFLYFHLTLKGKKEKNDAIYTSEMRISRKLHEELTHGVYDAITFSELNNLEVNENKERLLKKLDSLYSTTRTISKENSIIVTDEEYLMALKEMIAGFKTPELIILLNGFDAIFWNEINKNKKIILYRVLQELFLNMKKHSSATIVGITIKLQDKNFTVIYNDNGIGATKNGLIFKNGLQNVENRIKTINGTIIFDSNYRKGFKLSFTLPL